MESISNATAIFLVLVSSSLSLLLFFCILHWWSQRQQLPEKEDGDCSKPPELPVVPYSSNGLAYLQECAVCLAELEEGEKVKVIPVCGHVFHPSCIDRWLASSCSCPLCRRCSQIPESSMV